MTHSFDVHFQLMKTHFLLYVIIIIMKILDMDTIHVYGGLKMS